MRTVGLKAFEGILANHDRTQFATLVTATIPQMNKTGNRYHNRVYRLAQRNGTIGANYESVVNRQRLREERPADTSGAVEYFTADQLWNGKGRYVEGSRFLVRHTEKGGLYLAFLPRHDTEGHPRVMQDEYRWAHNDKPLADHDLWELKTFWLRAPQGSKRQEVERPRHWRTIKLANVRLVTLAGRDYVLSA